LDNCEDTFSFIPYSSWVGVGSESKSFINITPVKLPKKEEAPKSLQANVRKIEKSASSEKLKAPSLIATSEKRDDCNVEYPTGLICLLIITIMTLMGVLGGTIYYLFYYKSKSSKYKDKSIQDEVEETPKR